MKKFVFIFLFPILFVACKEETKKNTEVVETDKEEVVSEAVADESYISVGKEITDENVLAMAEMQERFNNLAIGDTIEVKYRAKVNEVCKKKGCWMKLENGENDDVMVKFKDYAFFVPKDIDNQEVIISGKAYVTEMSVEDRKHYAEDGGKSKEEIAVITEPKRTYSFLADRVLIAE